MSQQDSSGICAVITTYRPDDEFPDRVKRVEHQVSCIVIVDDGATPGNVTRLKHWFSSTPKVVLHHNKTNLGIAASLNAGIAIAKREGYSWVLTLDDDTMVAPNMVHILANHWPKLAATDTKPPALVGMLSRDPGTGTLSDNRAYSSHLQYTDKREIMTSGSLLSLEAYEAIGPFRNDFFIDFVDYDYCFRARSMGFRVIQVNEIGMEHSLGHLKLHKIAGRTVETYNHSPARRYYMFRNSTVFMKDVFWSDPLFALALLVSNLRTVALVTLLESERRAKLLHIVRGVVDGCCNRLGRTIPPS